MFSGIVERTVTLTDIRIEQQNKTFHFSCGFLRGVEDRSEHCPQRRNDLTVGGYYGGYLLRNGNERDAASAAIWASCQVGDIVNVGAFDAARCAARRTIFVQGHVDRDGRFVRPSMMPKAAGSF